MGSFSEKRRGLTKLLRSEKGFFFKKKIGKSFDWAGGKDVV